MSCISRLQKKRRRRKPPPPSLATGLAERTFLMVKSFLLLVMAAFLLAGCGGEVAEPAFAPETPVEATVQNEEKPEDNSDAGVEPEPEPEIDPKQLAVSTLLESMTLEEKIGQLFFARCPQSGVEEKIQEFHLGGVLLFTRDFKDFAGEWLDEAGFIDKIVSYQEASRIPLLVGVDEEGGTVARASRNPNLFPEKFRSPQQVFAAGDMEGVREDARLKSCGLLEYGINVNFAPVADVSIKPEDFIYERSFGQDAGKTAEFVKAVVEEMTAAGIGSVLKHFPGYGNNVDTHTGIALDGRPAEQFWREDFLPFQAGIEAGAPAVLVSHNVVSCFDSDFPASLSKEAHRVLREELGFEGVILTDDLAMGAVEAYAGDGSVAVLAVLAGNDMIVTTDFEEQIPLVADAVRTGLIEEDFIHQATERVLGWKFDLGLIGE